MDVEAAARLAKLRLDPQEKETLAHEMAQILHFADELAGLEAFLPPPEEEEANVWRQDRAEPFPLEAQVFRTP